MFYQRGRGFYHVDVSLFENYFLAGALSARLLACLLRPANNHALPEGVEAMDENAAKTVAICNQQGNGCNSPHDAEHGEEAACQVALQSDPGFEDDLNQHKQFSNWEIL